MLGNIYILNTVKTQVAIQVNLLQGEEEYERQKEKRWFRRLIEMLKEEKEGWVTFRSLALI